MLSEPKAVLLCQRSSLWGLYRRSLSEDFAAAELRPVTKSGRAVSDLCCPASESTLGASREEPREPYIMFADPKPYLVRRKKKAPWEKVEERLRRG